MCDLLSFGWAGDNGGKRRPMDIQRYPPPRCDCRMPRLLTSEPLSALIATHLVGVYDMKSRVAQTLHLFFNILFLMVLSGYCNSTHASLICPG